MISAKSAVQATVVLALTAIITHGQSLLAQPNPVAGVSKGDMIMSHASPDNGRTILRKSAAPTSPFTVPLYPGNAPEGGASPTLKVWLAPESTANGAAFVVCPGGSYSGWVSGPEGDAPSQWLNTVGVAGIVLCYRLGLHPIPMEDGQRAIQVVRSHAAEWGLDTSRIGMMGFSAGGHEAATVGTHFNDVQAKTGDAIDHLSCRPSFMILIYPVIAFDLGWGPPLNVVGSPPDTAIVHYLANDRHVTAQTPPTFLAHAADDALVPPVNSKAFYDSCISHGVTSSELHNYPHGGHGFFPYDSTISMWAKDGDAWMRRIGVYGDVVPLIKPQSGERVVARPGAQAKVVCWDHDRSLVQTASGTAELFDLKGNRVRERAAATGVRLLRQTPAGREKDAEKP
jgi:acetyl esterase/lipase